MSSEPSSSKRDGLMSGDVPKARKRVSDAFIQETEKAERGGRRLTDVVRTAAGAFVAHHAVRALAVRSVRNMHPLCGHCTSAVVPDNEMKGRRLPGCSCRQSHRYWRKWRRSCRCSRYTSRMHQGRRRTKFPILQRQGQRKARRWKQRGY